MIAEAKLAEFRRGTARILARLEERNEELLAELAQLSADLAEAGARFS